MFEENSFVFTFVAKLYGKRYFLSQWPGRTLFLNCDYVIAKITVDCERCQHSPDSYISFKSIIHPIRFD